MFHLSCRCSRTAGSMAEEKRICFGQTCRSCKCVGFWCSEGICFGFRFRWPFYLNSTKLLIPIWLKQNLFLQTTINETNSNILMSIMEAYILFKKHEIDNCLSFYTERRMTNIYLPIKSIFEHSIVVEFALPSPKIAIKWKNISQWLNCSRWTYTSICSLCQYLN